MECPATSKPQAILRQNVVEYEHTADRLTISALSGNRVIVKPVFA